MLLAVLCGALALPAGTLPRVSKERAVVAKEEPVAPAVNHNYHKFPPVRTGTRMFLFCRLLRGITLSTTTFKMVSSAWLIHAVRFSATELSGASIATAGPTAFLSLSRKEHHLFSISKRLEATCTTLSHLFLYSYTADETGFHPVITEEAAPNLFSPSAVQTMYSSDNPEQIKITLTEDDVDLTRQKAEAAKVAGNKLRTRVQSRPETNSQLIDQKDSRFSRMLIPVKIPAVNSQTRFNYYEQV